MAVESTVASGMWTSWVLYFAFMWTVLRCFDSALNVQIVVKPFVTQSALSFMVLPMIILGGTTKAKAALRIADQILSLFRKLLNSRCGPYCLIWIAHKLGLSSQVFILYELGCWPSVQLWAWALNDPGVQYLKHLLQTIPAQLSAWNINAVMPLYVVIICVWALKCNLVQEPEHVTSYCWWWLPPMLQILFFGSSEKPQNI